MPVILNTRFGIRIAAVHYMGKMSCTYRTSQGSSRGGECHHIGKESQESRANIYIYMLGEA